MSVVEIDPHHRALGNTSSPAAVPAVVPSSRPAQYGNAGSAGSAHDPVTYTPARPGRRVSV
ncbi:hypothetical protein [Mycolicibacterium senegalense]|uniref:hypothetical protein n=1 Tax=Mycolicibacterium senegalense TaxID=1796 RepID=UPI0015F11598|nr:hypothetical protein [Mycolicibacterium senegalense]